MNFPQSAIGRQNDNIMDTQNMPTIWCVDCGLLFASPVDLQRHTKHGCPEDDEPPGKRPRYDSDDDSGFDELINRVYEEYNDIYGDKVQKYMKDGDSEKKARQKATEDLFSKYVKEFTKLYRDHIIIMHNLERSPVHQKTMDDVDHLTYEKHYDFEEAVKIAVRKNKRELGELIDMEDGEDGESADSDESDGGKDKDN